MIRAVNVRKTELFAIRLLVTNVGGICSFDDMITYRGIKYDTFTDAAYARRLMNSQKEYLDLLKDALTREKPYVVRRMFADCIIYAGLLRPSEIWAILRSEMIDEKYKITKAQRRRGIAAALYHIDILLKRAYLSASEFNLDGPNLRLTPYQMVEAVNDMPSVSFLTPHSLTDEQQNVFDSVVECVESGKSQCFFLQASGGCGKTFLYRKIDTELRRRGKRVTNVASTGIASTLLRSGSTAHRQFFIPLNVDENKLSTMKMESLAARWLRGTDLIIFDEATMADKWILNCVDVLLQNIITKFRGDWKQLLPVVTARSAEVAEDFTLLSSPLWKHFKVLTLRKNIRAKNDPEFAEFLEETGEGRFNGKLSSFVQIDKPGVMMPSQASVLQSIYVGKLSDEDYLFKSCVLCTTNKQAEEVNKIVLSKVAGMERVYRAIDTPVEGLGRQIPPEAFHTNMESGMSPHVLILKKGAIIILLRNININAGPCNGTRLVITNMYDKYIEAKHLDPRWNGRVHQIERMHLTPPETATQKPPYSRFQFPLRLAYCLTINKSQGQTFERVGILLQRNVFAHGQLYVALSRVSPSRSFKDLNSFKDLKIFSRATKEGVEGIVLANTVSAYTIDRMKQAIAASRPIPDVSSQPATSSPPIRRPVTPPRLPTPPSPPSPITGPRDDFADIVMNQSTTARRPTTLSRPSVAPFTPLIRPSTRPLPPPRSPSIHPITPPPPARQITPIPPTQWLRLTNRGTDCFLNASLQCLRRIPEFTQSLANRDLEENVLTEAFLTELERILTTNGSPEGLISSSDLLYRVINHYQFPFPEGRRLGGAPTLARDLREMLPNVLPDRLEEDFLDTQQDATEIIIKLFQSLIPANITNQFKIKEHRWRRCRDTYNTTCTKRAIQPTFSVPSLIHVGEMNQVIDLEKRFSNVYYITDVDDDETGHHCVSCCTCCISHQGEEPVHVRDAWIFPPTQIVYFFYNIRTLQYALLACQRL